MKDLRPLLLFLLLFPFFINAQNDTLNKFNEKGKKNGYWKVLLNDKAQPVTDTADAYFYGIELWDKGNPVFSFHTYKWKYSKVVYNATLPEKGKPVLINGTFKWYSDKGLLLNEEVYKNGHPFFIKSYSWDKNDPGISVFNEVLYFDRLLNNIPGTFYYEEYGYNGNLLDRYWFRNGKKGWRVYKIRE